MQFLRQYIESMIEIDESEWQIVLALFSKRVYAKGDELLSAGEVCQRFFYVSSGVLRIYSITTEGKDLTWGINHQKKGYTPEPFSGDYVSYLTQQGSNFFIEAIEESTVYIADFSMLDKMYESSLKWMGLARQISDMQLVQIAQRAQTFARITAKEKYELMKKIAPVYEEVLPDYQYASVLGITPQSLSRIKSVQGQKRQA